MRHLQHSYPKVEQTKQKWKLIWKENVCDRCGSELYCREDDNQETVRKRLSVYHDMTEPLKAYYEDKGILVKVASKEEVEETTKAMFAALGEHYGNN